MVGLPTNRASTLSPTVMKLGVRFALLLTLSTVLVVPADVGQGARPGTSRIDSQPAKCGRRNTLARGESSVSVSSDTRHLFLG